jgi:mono/diheme cytochrome c family protein
MFRLTITTTAVALLGVFISYVSEADAEDPHLGVIEYEISCMPCHGVEGHGDGRLAPALRIRPADLTKIAKANKGVFPASKVVDIIDGRAIVSIHGPREMPVWGDRYRKPIEPNEPFARIEQRARRQINALVEYLKTLQEKD